jgi:hypothetical protein
MVSCPETADHPDQTLDNIAALMRSSLPTPGSRNSGSSTDPSASRSAITDTASRNTEPPPERREQQPTRQWPDGGAGREARGPHPDGEGALIRVSEHVADQREGGGRQRGPGDVEHGACDAQHLRGAGESSEYLEGSEGGGPIRSSRLRPIRSPELPIVIRNPASRQP